MALAWIAIYASLVVGSFINPVYGVVGYLFEYYLRPALNWWGKPLPDLRWNFTICAVLAATYFMRRSSLPDIGPARKGPAKFLLAMLLVMTLVTPIAAVNRDASWQKTLDYAKLILFHGLVVGTVRTELAFDAVAITHIAGSAWWGWQAFDRPKRAAGRLQNVGSGDTIGDNGTAAHLLTVLPFIVVYALLHKDLRVRGFAMFAAPLVLNTIILCNSRGATIGMVVAAAAMFVLARSGHRLRAVGMAVVVAVALLALADPQFIARQQNTSYDDGSAQGRLEAWRGSLQLVKDHPLGAGGEGFYELSPQYAAGLVEQLGEKRDPHNTFVLVASEWGILGFGLFIGYIVSVFRLLREVRRTALNSMWYYRSVAVQLGFIGLLVAGCFTDRFYAEAPYWMGAFAVALHRIHRHELARSKAPAETPAVEQAAVPPGRFPFPRPA
jgi:hypothetical protein